MLVPYRAVVFALAVAFLVFLAARGNLWALVVLVVFVGLSLGQAKLRRDSRDRDRGR